MQVPFVDLKAQYLTISREIDVAIKRVLHDGIFIGGHEVESFEKEFARYIGGTYCISLNSGTDALILGTRALELAPHDEVIFSVNTYYATALAATWNSLTPVFVDMSDEDFGISLADLKRKINSRTKAIFLTHLYGQSDKIGEVKDMIKKTGRKIHLIEDCAQAHGALYNKKKVGNFGVFSAFSFYPSKNLGAYGDGGAIITSDSALTKKIKRLKEYGQSKKNLHESIGVNSRLDSIHAAILRTKLKKINVWNKHRRQRAGLYNQLLGGISELKVPAEFVERPSVYHLYVIQTPKRDKLHKYLLSKRVITQIHYPFPLHEQKAFAFLKHKKTDFPLASKRAREILSLPMYPELTNNQIHYVANTIREFYNS